MGDLSHEPSMEDILSSIKKIIADDGDKQNNVPRLRRASPRQVAPESITDTEFDVLELTEAVQEAESRLDPIAHLVHAHPAESSTLPVPAPEPAVRSTPPLDSAMKSSDDSILAETSVSVSRSAFAQLNAEKSKAKAVPNGPYDHAIEGLVIEALRPMLKDWLDANLPRMVEKMVAKEIARLRED